MKNKKLYLKLCSIIFASACHLFAILNSNNSVKTFAMESKKSNIYASDDSNNISNDYVTNVNSINFNSNPLYYPEEQKKLIEKAKKFKAKNTKETLYDINSKEFAERDYPGYYSKTFTNALTDNQSILLKKPSQLKDSITLENKIDDGDKKIIQDFKDQFILLKAHAQEKTVTKDDLINFAISLKNVLALYIAYILNYRNIKIKTQNAPHTATMYLSALVSKIRSFFDLLFTNDKIFKADVEEIRNLNIACQLSWLERFLDKETRTLKSQNPDEQKEITKLYNLIEKDYILLMGYSDQIVNNSLVESENLYKQNDQ